MEGGKVRVALLKSERAKGKTESDVVDGVGFGGGGGLGVWDGDFDLRGHDEGGIMVHALGRPWSICYKSLINCTGV